MTRKDYIKIAAIIKRSRQYASPKAAIECIETNLINLFIDDNPRFDAQRFRDAAK